MPWVIAIPALGLYLVGGGLFVLGLCKCGDSEND